ncbi:S8 family serine peptidase [Streptomyces sp. NPDC048643]|uniref:S8 family peptidase n=1 Tax=Streptomyces sp. NPDC048643 TaxID=3155637 RepID=UPI003430F6A6
MAISMMLIATTPSTSLALAGPSNTGSPSPLGSTPRTSPTESSPAQRWIPLITGDRIAVDSKGRALSVRSAEGREDIPIRVETVGGHTYALPDDARRLVDNGRLDRRLFDITTLSTPAYAQRQDVRLIVRYDDDRPTARRALRTTPGADVLRTLTSIDADAITAPANGTSTLWSAITSGAARTTDRTVAPGIASVWLDAVVHASLDTSVPQIGGPEAWAAGFDGTGSRIAVLDSGIDTTHPDLAGQVVAEHNFSNSPTTGDGYGHGTHVASIAAGTGAKSGGRFKGVAPGARILNGKVLDDTGSGSMSQIIAGMEWAVAEKADVANLSLGTYDSPGTDPMEEAVDTLSSESHTLFVVAAGNNGEQGSATISTPGSADAALTVGAVDKQDALAPFSSTGPRIGDNAVKPDLTAPGVDIGAAVAHDSYLANVGTPVADGYIALSGTSMASPHVAGAAAILAQQHPEWTGDEIKQALVASAAPGPYTAFQQGSGRVDLRTAIKQAVFTRETSLSFGIAQWPHTDDQPLDKNLTYRNMGDTSVTLKLTVDAKGPDGSPAPKGMFTAPDQVIVPGHGEATVKIVADTRLGNAAAGRFTGRITAAGAGQSVGTALAVERESEMYSVTFKPLDRQGKPAPTGSWDATLAGLTGPLLGSTMSVSGDTYSVRVPKGRYFVNGFLRVDPAGTTAKGADWLNQPSLDVTKDTVVTLDARTAKPIDVTVPDRSAYPSFGFINASNAVPDGGSASMGVFVTSFKGLRTAHLGPKAPSGDLTSQHLSLSFSTGADGHDDYHLLYQPKADRFLTGFTRHTGPGDFADVRTKLGAPAQGKSGFISPSTELSGGLGTTHTLPYTGTLHLLTDESKWWLTFYQVDADDTFESRYGAPARAYEPGHSYRRTFNVGVFGPDLPEGAHLIRNGDFLDGGLPLFSDGSGNQSYNQSPIASARTEVYRNGELVSTSPHPMDFFYVADPERADYRVVVSVDRGTVADVSSSLSTEWTFSSEHTQGITDLPVSVVRFTPALSLHNTGRARAEVWVPVAVKGPAEGRNLRSLRVWVSYDKGVNWEKTPVRDGRIRVANPRAGHSVSFKAEAVDRQGNTVKETILDAYLTK